MHEPSPTDTVNKSLKVTENAVLTWWCPKICNAAVEIEVVKVHYRMRTGRSKFTEQHCHSQICSLCSVPGDATAAYHTNRQTSISILMKEKICGEVVGYRGRCKQTGSSRMSMSQWPSIIPWSMNRRTVFQRGPVRDHRCFR